VRGVHGHQDQADREAIDVGHVDVHAPGVDGRFDILVPDEIVGVVGVRRGWLVAAAETVQGGVEADVDAA
jgi:hypothetical protein